MISAERPHITTWHDIIFESIRTDWWMVWRPCFARRMQFGFAAAAAFPGHECGGSGALLAEAVRAGATEQWRDGASARWNAIAPRRVAAECPPSQAVARWQSVRGGNDRELGLFVTSEAGKKSLRRQRTSGVRDRPARAPTLRNLRERCATEPPLRVLPVGRVKPGRG